MVPIDIYRTAVEFLDQGRRFAVAVVLSADGSTPQKPGARGLIDASGKIWGTVGGGSVEAEAQRRAIEVCQSQHPAVLEARLDNACEADAGPICGGAMRILLAPAEARDRHCYAQAVEALRQRRRGVLLTTLCGTAPLEVTLEWLPEEAISARDGFPEAEAIRACLARETPKLFVDSSPSQRAREAFVEPVIPSALLVIAGGGHVGQALARQAVQLGFEVTVVDDRPEFADAARFPEGTTVRCGPIPQHVAELARAPGAYIVIVTRGHKDDGETLAACIHAPAAYIGMIGSRRKVALMGEDFLRRGVATAAELGRVFAPIGLEIGAVTVAEIATSIAAQLVAIRRHGGAPHYDPQHNAMVRR